ncbi:MAG: polysaccharide biosynthesis tyrosine autokinase [Gammaproteobacteria bacterium]|nr:MAG: polysaccharide biosynthesis tyrosine autokinase [Gammaproteobacteria bacterium]
MNRGNSTIPVDEDWETGDEIDWRYYWSIINRRKWSIIGLALGVGLLTTLVVFAMTPIYRASTTLLIESQAPNVVSIQEVYGLDTRSQDYLATQIEIMGGRPIAETVVDGLGLIEQPAFRPQHLDWRSWLPGMQKKAMSRQSERESAVDAYLGNLSIAPVRMTQLVRVEFESPDPRLAARVAEAHAKAYIESTLEARAEATRSATEWMATRLESLRKELQASEASLQAYREQEHIVDATGLKALPASEISNLSARLLEVRQTLAAAKIAYLQVTPVDGQAENLLGVPALLADEGMRRAQAAQATAQQAVAELEKRYGLSHPKMIAAQSELAQATENLNNQAHSVTEGIRKRYEAATSEEAAIVAALNRAGQQYQQVGRKESKLESLQRTVDTNRQLYDLFLKRLSETSATGDLANARARIVQHAVVPRLPAEPNKRRIVSIAVLLTLLFGVGVAFLLASLDNTVKSSRDVEEKLKRPLLGIEPLLGSEALRAACTLGKSDETRETDPRFAEAMRTIRTAISLDSLDKPHKIILVTSSIGSEGKSIFALNLAVTFGRGERTLLLDGDLRRPSVGKMLGLPRDAPGLSELLTNRAQLSEIVIGTGVNDLHAISTGFIPPDPLQILSSSRMASALKVLAHSFSRIVIDCPPILPVSDAAVLSKYAHCVLYVVKSDTTKVPQIRNGLALLERVGAPIMGIVLTQFDVRKAEKYGDYDYGSYEPGAGPSRA